jgi:hypothetical protein
MRFHHMTWLAAGLVSIFVGAGCSDSSSDPEAMGRAQVRLITPQVSPFELTRVTLDTDTGFSADLARDPQTGDFTGTLGLPAGVHELTGSAFVGTTLVGVGNPVPVDIQPGAVSRVMIQILDITGGSQPGFTPLLESLSHPSATTAGTEVLFAASVVDLDGTPVSYSWSDDCSDSIFTAPQSGVTGWSKASSGTCRITLTAESAGDTMTAAFSIAVFGTGADLGAVEVVGEFVPALQPQLSFSVGGEYCHVTPHADDASCSLPIASPDMAFIYAYGSIESGDSGSITLVDDCGGTFAVEYEGPGYIQTYWLPPTQGGICRLTLRAVSQEGVLSEISMAVAVRPGTPRVPSEGPSVSANLYLYEYGYFCSVYPGQEEVYCGLTPAGGAAQLDGNVDWGDSFPGTIEITDDCGGAFFDGSTDVPGGYFYSQWQSPGSAAGCTITVTATSLEGLTSSGSFVVDVL